MEKFFALPEEKQRNIIDAAMGVFGEVGYKKAFISEIAENAGISKAMIFYYFGTKKELYLYLMNTAFGIVEKAFKEALQFVGNDVFERIALSTTAKISVLKKYPPLIKFMTSVYFETDKSVSAEIASVLKEGTGIRNDFVFSDFDTFKFKDTINPQLALKILMKYSDGYLSGLSNDAICDLDTILIEFNECMEMMKTNFYKEEYVK